MEVIARPWSAMSEEVKQSRVRNNLQIRNQIRSGKAGRQRSEMCSDIQTEDLIITEALRDSQHAVAICSPPTPHNTHHLERFHFHAADNLQLCSETRCIKEVQIKHSRNVPAGSAVASLLVWRASPNVPYRSDQNHPRSQLIHRYTQNFRVPTCPGKPWKIIDQFYSPGKYGK